MGCSWKNNSIIWTRKFSNKYDRIIRLLSINELLFQMGQGSLQEMPVKITKTVVDSSTTEKKESPNKQSPILNRVPINQPTLPKTIQNVQTPTRTQVKPAQPTQQNTSRIAKRTADNMEVDESVEKILAKRFNPRKKMYEYLVKWENFTHEQNTWEQVSHFDQCKHLLEHFEEQLAKQKEQRAKFQQLQNQKQQQQQQAATPKPAAATLLNSASPVNRPQRNSKSKAMDQVKQWIATEDDANSGNAGIKRKLTLTDDDYDDEEQEDDLSMESVKKIKTDNPAVQQALLKAGQSGNVRIVQVNKTSPVKPNQIITTKIINGSSGFSESKNSAEIVISKDSKATGVIKKPGAILSAGKTSLTEAKIRVLSKGESVPSGVVRIIPHNDENAGQTTVTPKSSPIQVAQANKVTVLNQLKAQSAAKQGSPSPTAPKPIPSGIRSAATPISQAPQQKRFSLSPDTTVHNKTTITRIPQKSQSVPSLNKTSTSEHAMRVVTYRNSEGKIIKKTIPVQSPLATKSLTASPNVSFNSNLSTSQSSRNQEEEEEEDPAPDPFPQEVAEPEPDSPPLPMSLCPITGKVLLKAEGEKTPPPSPPASTLLEKTSDLLKFNASSSKTDEQKAAETEEATMQTLQPMTNEDGTPLLVTGEDGTIYQIAGKNEEGQTILIAQGADGEQQCMYVAAQEDEDGALAMNTAEGAASGDVGQLIQEGQSGEEQTQYIIKQQDDGTPPQTLTLSIEGSDSQDGGQITAEVVQADLPSPGMNILN